MWACGVILFILLAGVPPLELPALTDPRYRMIQAGKLGELMDVWQMRISREAKHLLESLLKAVPEERAKMEEVIRHPWLTG
jgi:serine/threonine protein kinase